MTHDEARTIQFLRCEIGCTHRRITEAWAFIKNTDIPVCQQQYGALLVYEAEKVLNLPVGAFDEDMDRLTFSQEDTQPFDIKSLSAS